MHGLLQTRAGMARGGDEFVENPAEDHQGHLSVAARLGARERWLFPPETFCDEVHKDLSKSLLLVASGVGKRRVHHKSVELGMLAIEADAEVDQRMHRVVEAQGACRVERSFVVRHLACIHGSERAGDSFLVGEELVKRCRRDACFQGNRVRGGLVIAEAAKDGSRCAEELVPALFSPGVAFAFWIVDCHRLIFAEKE